MWAFISILPVFFLSFFLSFFIHFLSPSFAMYSTFLCILGLAAPSLIHALPINPFQHRAFTKKDGGNPKYVVAHHMVGNTFPYTEGDWLSDITQAHSAGIDGFALNIGSDSWQATQVASA